MKILLINWSKGENDPFSYFSESLRVKMRNFGYTCQVIELAEDFGAHFFKALERGIDFAMTWQGLGSQVKRDASAVSIWDEFKIPLFCMHSDHPCHYPPNHVASSDYVFHVYGMGSFAAYANRYIPRKRPALHCVHPNVFLNDRSEKTFEEDCFYFPKNLHDPELIKQSWLRRFTPRTAGFLIEVAQRMENEWQRGETRSHHEAIDEMLSDEIFPVIKSELKIEDDITAFHAVHATLDPYYRNSVAAFVIDQLGDYKIKVHGRGWERYKSRDNKNHEFHDFGSVADGAFQFRSNYGILDVAPVSDSLHDRTQRACVHQSGFMIGSNWHKCEYVPSDHSDLFFNGTADDLKSKAERIVENPARHREKVQAFHHEFELRFSLFGFLKQLEQLRFLLLR